MNVATLLAASLKLEEIRMTYNYRQLLDDMEVKAAKLTDLEIKTIREKMVAMQQYNHGIRLSIKKMTQYLIRVHPELIVDLKGTSVRKDTPSGRLRIPGNRDYNGYELRVWTDKAAYDHYSRAGNLIDHDTTETYRRNDEVARKIIYYEKDKVNK